MFTIGATNRPDLLDSALLRTGRFDKMIYLGVAKTVEERTNILKAQMKNIKFNDDVKLEDVCSQIPENFTGADFSALTTESYMIAAKEKIEKTKKEVELWKADNKDLISQDEELPLETYIKLRYPDDTES